MLRPAFGWGGFAAPGGLMPAPPKWTALPSRLDLLLARMVEVTEYPVPASDGRARCGQTVGSAIVADPHDWRRWRTGSFVASYDHRIERWPLQLRRCTACEAVEVRIVRAGKYIPSLMRQRRVFRQRPQLLEDEVIGWYHGSPT